ncbi:MAG: hypothetical protein JNL32_00180 [Candidatus Kapabacteria bacterium]|nr:hypothetical protein [Candidatus Kapabacteria bacterium]
MIPFIAVPGGIVAVNGKSGTAVTIEKSDVGLGNVANLAPAVANGVATLGADGLLEAAQRPGSSGVADGSVTTAKVADGAITSAKIADATIATGDIADGAITSAKIADATIATGDIADGAITSAKISDGTIVNADISASAAIAFSKLSGVAAASHSHSQSDISGLVTALSGKQDTSQKNNGNGYAGLSPWGFALLSQDNCRKRVVTSEPSITGTSTPATIGMSVVPTSDGTLMNLHVFAIVFIKIANPTQIPFNFQLSCSGTPSPYRILATCTGSDDYGVHKGCRINSTGINLNSTYGIEYDNDFSASNVFHTLLISGYLYSSGMDTFELKFAPTNSGHSITIMSGSMLMIERIFY